MSHWLSGTDRISGFFSRYSIARMADKRVPVDERGILRCRVGVHVQFHDARLPSFFSGNVRTNHDNNPNNCNSILNNPN